MRYQTVPVKNVLTLNAALESIKQRNPCVPGLGLIHGRTGSGKTTALTSTIIRTKAAFMRANSAITLSSLLDDLIKELKVEGRSGRNADKFHLICEKLKEGPRPVFIDEADYLVHDVRMLEILRDIHDSTGTPIMLVGMAGIERKLASRPQFARRISQRIEFHPCDLEDAQLVTRAICEVEIAPDLLSLMHRKAQGAIGLMVVALAQFETFAKGARLQTLDAGAWADRPMFLGSDQVN